jgi:signal transduction histidine kinase/CheY-like chemotaxis protein
MSQPATDVARPVDEAEVARFVHERFVGLFLSQNRRAQLGLLVAAALLAVLWHAAAPGPAALGWIAAVGGVSLLRYLGTDALLRRAADAAAATRRIAMLLLVNGVLLAVPLLAFGSLSELQRAAASIILLGGATASVATTSGYRAIFLAFAAPMLVPLGVAWMLVGAAAGRDDAALGIGILVLLYLLFLLSISRQVHAIFEESCRFRYGEQQLNRELTHALDRLGEANRAKTQFLAAASHDLRQPIHSLNVLVAALGLRPLDDRSREIVSLLDAVNQAMAKQLDGLLDISRLDAGTVQPALADLRLDELLAAHHAALAPLAKERSLDFTLDAEPGIGVRSDGALLLRIVGNLTDNAFKFTPPGGRVAIALRRDGAHAVLSVSDSGIGIARDEHERVFREFYQVGNTERDRSRGLGLGLSIVQRLCALLGIHLALQSAPAAGTTVTLRMPALDASPAAAVPAAARAALPPGLGVLVIDDEPAVRSSMQLLLTELGCTVHLADSTDAARRIAAEHRIDAVLSDFRLRDGDSGVVAMRAVRHLHPGARAALVTGDTAPSRLRDARWAGVPLLHKPVRVDELLDVLQPAAHP